MEFAKLLHLENMEEEEAEEEGELDDLTPPFPILQMSLDLCQSDEEAPGDARRGRATLGRFWQTCW